MLKKIIRRAAKFAAALGISTTLVAALLVATASPASALSAPTISTLKAEGAFSASITWTAVPGATAYQWQSSTSTKFTSPLSGIVTTNGVPYIKDLTVAKVNYFRVRTWDAVGNVATSDWSPVKSVKPVYTWQKAGKVSLVTQNSTRLEVAWTHITGAPSYIVRAKATGKPTVYAGVESGSQVVLNGLVRNTTYSIQVCIADKPKPEADLPIRNVGAYSTAVKIKTLNNTLNGPMNLVASNATNTTVDLEFDAPDGVNAATDIYQIVYAYDTSIKKSKKTFYTADVVGSGTQAHPKFTVTGMPENRNLYAKVQVIDKATKKVRSDLTDYVLLKTLMPYGTISGKVTGYPSGKYKDVLIEAYRTTTDNQVGVLSATADLASDGKYTLNVAANAQYRVVAQYIGQDNYKSTWNNNVARYEDAPVYPNGHKLVMGETVANINIALAQGIKITGVVTNSSGSGLQDVDVSAMSGNEMIARTRTAAGGGYTLDGLTPGLAYKLHFHYLGGGKSDKNYTVTPTGNLTYTTVKLS
ncbi:MAG: carboxypeptidase-like regulatory domain-containing protein [Propionibacteriaceae bacterium]|jgi:molybdopterin-binding protein|nr:carboxypeptidase-like regulatory domain-containing protein [Propionibacteriaceae bacterium]